MAEEQSVNVVSTSEPLLQVAEENNSSGSRSRTTTRSNAAVGLQFRVEDEAESIHAKLEITWKLMIIIVSVAVLISATEESPTIPIRLWVIVCAIQSLIDVVLIVMGYSWDVRQCKSISTVITFVWAAFGAYWVETDDFLLKHNAPRLFWLAVVLINFRLLIPFIIGVFAPCICCCLPGDFINVLRASQMGAGVNNYSGPITIRSNDQIQRLQKRVEGIVYKLEITWKLMLIIVSVSMLFSTREESTNVPIRRWIIVFAIQCLIDVVLIIVIIVIGNCRWVKLCNTLVTIIWWITGVCWVASGGSLLKHNAPRLYWSAVVLLASRVFIGFGYHVCLPWFIKNCFSAESKKEVAAESDPSVDV